MKSRRNILVMLAMFGVIGIVQAGPEEQAATPVDRGIANAVADKMGEGFQEGADIELTLDNDIQQYVVQALDEAMTNFRPQSAWAIVEEVRTGAILAMASLPKSNPSPAAGTVFEPGSIFKVGVVAAALNEGLISTNDQFDCENGVWSYEGKPLRDFHPYGVLDVTGILRKSSNIGAAKIALKLGEESLHRYLAAFGFGRPTGIELPGEESGVLRLLSEWGKADITRVAMGHTVSVTALQMLNMLCCIGNDGVLLKPHLVRRVVGKDGVVLLDNKPEVVAQAISAATAKLVRNMLVAVTREGGTGTRAAVKGFNVAGKTGTAEKMKDGRYAANQNIVSFMGVLPAERPEIGIIVVLDNPHPMYTGSMSAAPIFARIAEAAVRHLGIREDDPD